MNPLSFLDSIGEWVADLVAVRVQTLFHQELVTLETQMANALDTLNQLSTDVKDVHTKVQSSIQRLLDLTQQIADLKAGNDPAVSTAAQAIDDEVRAIASDLQGVTATNPPTPPTTPPPTGTPPAPTGPTTPPPPDTGTPPTGTPPPPDTGTPPAPTGTPTP